jgi:hypothetical protein
MGSIHVFAVLTGYCDLGRRKWLACKDGGCVLAYFKAQDVHFKGEPAIFRRGWRKRPTQAKGARFARFLYLKKYLAGQILRRDQETKYVVHSCLTGLAANFSDEGI